MSSSSPDVAPSADKVCSSFYDVGKLLMLVRQLRVTEGSNAPDGPSPTVKGGPAVPVVLEVEPEIPVRPDTPRPTGGPARAQERSDRRKNMRTGPYTATNPPVFAFWSHFLVAYHLSRRPLPPTVLPFVRSASTSFFFVFNLCLGR
jgi:hypothetical protein